MGRGREATVQGQVGQHGQRQVDKGQEEGRADGQRGVRGGVWRQAQKSEKGQEVGARIDGPGHGRGVLFLFLDLGFGISIKFIGPCSGLFTVREWLYKELSSLFFVSGVCLDCVWGEEQTMGFRGSFRMARRVLFLVYGSGQI